MLRQSWRPFLCCVADGAVDEAISSLASLLLRYSLECMTHSTTTNSTATAAASRPQTPSSAPQTTVRK